MGQPIFIDLLPDNYINLDLIPYNFIFLYGDDTGLPPSTLENFSLRGLRAHMDYPNSKLKGFYYLKLALHHADTPPKADEYFAKIKAELPQIQLIADFIRDYKGGTGEAGMF